MLIKKLRKHSGQKLLKSRNLDLQTSRLWCLLPRLSKLPLSMRKHHLKRAIFFLVPTMSAIAGSDRIYVLELDVFALTEPVNAGRITSKPQL